MPPIGTLNVGDVVVRPGAIQVASLQAQVGDPATGPLMSVTPTIKTVTINADSADIPSLRQRWDTPPIKAGRRSYRSPPCSADWPVPCSSAWSRVCTPRYAPRLTPTEALAAP
jgi:hypothetical protein